MFILWLRDRHPAPLLVLSAAAILASLATIGGLLDGRRACVRDEMLRLAATALLGLAYVCLWDHGAVGGAILVASIAGAGTLAGIDRAIEVQAVPALRDDGPDGAGAAVQKSTSPRGRCRVAKRPDSSTPSTRPGSSITI